MPIYVRKAVMADLPELLRMGRAFYELSKWPDMCGFDEEFLKKGLGFIIQSQATNNALLLVSDHVPDVLDGKNVKPKLGGMMALLAFPGYFDPKSRMVQELFWYADDGKGLELITKAKEWVAKTGGGIMMIAETGPGNIRNSRVYERMGFEPIERAYAQNVAHEIGK